MAEKCAWCRSRDVQHATDIITCLNCGEHTYETGEKANRADEFTGGWVRADVPAPSKRG